MPPKCATEPSDDGLLISEQPATRVFENVHGRPDRQTGGSQNIDPSVVFRPAGFHSPHSGVISIRQRWSADEAVKISSERRGGASETVSRAPP